MDKVSHTQGPWNVFDYAGDYGKQFTVATAEGKRIADNLEVGWHTQEAKANARLIAAAPDLLAACQLAEDWIATARQFGMAPVGIVDAANALRAAIAKATNNA